MPLKIAFDIYGTLFDTQGVVFLLKVFIGDLADEFSSTWRNKQLEYSFSERVDARLRGFFYLGETGIRLHIRLLSG